MNFRNANVVVTGAGGFIGSHLVERLVNMGANVHCIFHYNSLSSLGNLDSSTVKDSIRITFADVRYMDSLRNAFSKHENVEAIFHLAALISVPYSYISPESFVQTNIQGTLNMLQLAQELHVQKFIHTSSSEVYGSAQYTPIDEKHPIHPQSVYAVSKAAADYLAQCSYYTHNLPVVTIRPFNTFGPRQSTRALIPTIITQALFKDEIRLGNLTPVRDFTYVADTVTGFIKTVDQGAIAEVYNIGTGEKWSVLDIATMVKEITQRSIPVLGDQSIRSRPENSEVMALISSHEKARTRLGWTYYHGLHDGLRKTIDWFRENYDPKGSTYNV